jgi:hypothetical protein
MPPTGSLDPAQVAVIKTWIDQGATWPDEASGDVIHPAPDPAALAMAESLRQGNRTRFAEQLKAEGAAVDLRGTGGSTPLMYAVLYGDRQGVEALLARGADPNRPNDAGSTALMWAVDDVELTRVLLEYGADPRARSDEGLTPVFIAARWSRPGPVLQLLLDYGADPPDVAPGAAPRLVSAPVAEDGSVPAPRPAGSVRRALERSIPLLQRTDMAFIRKSGCVSCHNNSLTEMTLATARRFRVPFDAPVATEEIDAVGRFLEANRERALQGLGIPGGIDTVGYILLGLAEAEYPADEATDVWARYLKNRQEPSGRWPVQARRPPIESSDVQTTATAMRALQAYGIKTRRSEYEEAVRRAAVWLENAEPQTTEDRAFQLLGLHWARVDRAALRTRARALLAEQHLEGGWAQVATLTSDAYATGQALVALRQAGVLDASDASYRRGVQYLLDSQLEDGSWHVRTRATPVQPFFDGDFPHGRDQFISVAATNWAVMALAAAFR